MESPLDVGEIVARHEKTFEYKGHSRPYLLFPCTNPNARKGLLVSFGSWGGVYSRIRGYYEHQRDRYDLLYLQDNLGHENRGVWYLAEDGDFWPEACYQALLESVMQQQGVSPKKTGFFGSSMGGFAALYFGFRLRVASAVAICPLVGMQSRYQTVMPDVYRRVMPDESFDLNEYIFRTFHQSVPTHSHLLFCKDDDKIIQAEITRLVTLLIEHHNAFSLHSYDIHHPPEEHPHNAILRVSGEDRVIQLLESSLHIPVDTTEAKP